MGRHADTVTVEARSGSSPRFARNRARRLDRELVPCIQSACGAPAMHALVPAARVDPFVPLCHSARIVNLVSARHSPRSCTPPHPRRRARRRIHFPSTTARALNPAAQFN